MNETWFFCGQAHPTLAREVARNVGIPLGRAELGHFPDGELRIQIREHVHGDHVFVLQPLCSSEAIIELLLLTNALKNCRPRRLALIVTYYGYGRQERRTGQSPVSAQALAVMLNHSGADFLITVDLHAPLIHGFVALPHLELHSAELFADCVRRRLPPDETTIVVSPDRGGTERARRLACALNTDQPALVLQKNRTRPDCCEVREDGASMNLTGTHAILVDDIVSTGGTLIQAARHLSDQGADRIWACVTHLVGSPQILGRRLCDSPIEYLFVTNSLQNPEPPLESRIQVLSLAPLLETAVLRLIQRSSSPMFAHSLGQVLLRATDSFVGQCLSERVTEGARASPIQRLGSLASQ